MTPVACWSLPPLPGVAGRFTDAVTGLTRPDGLRGQVAVHQVHGTEVVEYHGQPVAAEADALIARRDAATLQQVLTIKVADCLPVILVDASGDHIAAAHAGRVGLLAGVLPATVDALRSLGVRDLHAWVGPHICGDCYEVPEEMATVAGQILPATTAVTSWGTPALDLAAGAVAQLADMGVQTDLLGPCTRTTPSLHSYRRDGAAAGRQSAQVWFTERD